MIGENKMETKRVPEDEATLYIATLLEFKDNATRTLVQMNRRIEKLETELNV